MLHIKTRPSANEMSRQATNTGSNDNNLHDAYSFLSSSEAARRRLEDFPMQARRSLLNFFGGSAIAARTRTTAGFFSMSFLRFLRLKI
jgi:hypothetical protein